MVEMLEMGLLEVLVGPAADPKTGAKAGPLDTWDLDQPLLPEHHMHWLLTAA